MFLTIVVLFMASVPLLLMLRRSAKPKGPVEVAAH